MRFKNGTSRSHGGRRHPPYAFTDDGIGMISSVLRSPRAVSVNIEIVRAFVRLRRHALTHQELERKVNLRERKYDANFKLVFDAIRKLIAPEEHKRTLGFARKKG